MKIKVICVWGSYRCRGNTEFLISFLKDELVKYGAYVEIFNLCNMNIEPCKACWMCVNKRGFCSIKDDMTKILIPKIIAADALVVGSPVYFNNVSACVKKFIDRTWCLKGLLRNKIGGAIVVGRGYGAELALAAIHAFMLKHEMILGFRGVTGFAFRRGEIRKDSEALMLVRRLAKRIIELAEATTELRKNTTKMFS